MIDQHTLSRALDEILILAKEIERLSSPIKQEDSALNRTQHS